MSEGAESKTNMLVCLAGEISGWDSIQLAWSSLHPSVTQLYGEWDHKVDQEQMSNVEFGETGKAPKQLCLLKRSSC